MRFVPGKMLLALAAMVMCLSLSAMPGEAADLKSKASSHARAHSNFGIFIGPGNGHHFNHYYDRRYGGFPFYRFNNAVGSTSIYGLPYVSRGYYNRYYRAHYKRRHYKRGHKQYKRTGYKSGKWCHYHTSKLPRTKKHSKVRCHKHRLHRHESIVHTRVAARHFPKLVRAVGLNSGRAILMSGLLLTDGRERDRELILSGRRA